MPLDEPNMSDNTLLVSVEDLINIGMGPDDKNVVNFKIVQTVLHILARQQRLLQQRVEIRLSEIRHPSPPRTVKKGRKGKSSEGSSPSSSPSPPKKRPPSAKDAKTKDTGKSDKEKADKEKARAEKEAKKREEKEKARLEKEREKADRSAKREMEKAEKEKGKAERSAEKEKEKAERAAEKEKEKAARAAEKEKEKAARATEKERGKLDKAAEKEREKAEKAERKEKERAEKEAAKASQEKERGDRSQSPGKDKKKPKAEAVPSISISEVERGKEKVLVVEKGPTTRTESRARAGSIDVVTQSQFALLEAAVKGLMEKTAPMGELRMPDNEGLKSALAKGSASLTDTMKAMQVNARVKAAEEAIDRMAGLLTQLAAAGAVPEALADQVAEAKREAERTLTTSDTDDAGVARPSTARKSVAIDPMAKRSVTARPSTARASSVPTPRGSISTVMGRASVMSQPSSTITTVPEPKVTRGEMEDIVRSVKDDLWKNMNAMTTKATAAAESAMHTAKTVSDRLEVAVKLDNRISNLHSLVSDYAEQLSGFDAGLTTQMQSFQEQMTQIRGDLTGGLKLLETVNNNAETAAVLELTERYEELVNELDRTMSAHRALSDFQGKLSDELRNLLESVEMLREQKADRDEVIDGLRDKADTSRLAGLLTEVEFALARAELQRRLDVCHDKFRRQDGIWMIAIKDLLKTTDLKAEIIDLLSMRDDTQWQLRELHSKLRLLASILGEPQAAIVTRKLARDATCGACGVPALMTMKDPSTGVPPAFPALRPPPPVEEPCLRDLKDWMPPDSADDRHICLRWCGGSHTLLSERTTREEAPPLVLDARPTRKFADYGRDGRLYMMEEELQPCLECNELLEKRRQQEEPAQGDLERPPPVGEEGAGDQGSRKTSTI